MMVNHAHINYEILFKHSKNLQQKHAMISVQ